MEAKMLTGAEVAENLVFGLAKLPIIKVNRDEFLRRELGKYCEEKVVEYAVATSVRKAQIPREIIDHIADGCILAETTEVVALSAAAGFPGGAAMLGTIPADTMQFYAHVLRLAQKLAYLYTDWRNLVAEDADEGTRAMMMILLGVALGTNGASTLITTVGKGLVGQTQRKIARTAVTRTTWYPLLKKLCEAIGIKLTKDGLIKGLSKAVPVIGSVTNAGVSLISFRPMAKRLKNQLRIIV